MREFPVEDVEASISDEELQAKERAELTDEVRDSLSAVREAALKDGAPREAEWIFFSSPAGPGRRSVGEPAGFSGTRRPVRSTRS
jgi:hypothetical protein